MACVVSIIVIYFVIVRFVISAALPTAKSSQSASLVPRSWECSEYYGKPIAEHCQDALDQISDSGTQMFFVSKPVDAPLSEPIQQMPKFFNSRSGDCTISIRSAVDDEPDEDNRDYDTDSWRHIKTTARQIIARCIRIQEMGGFKTAGEYQDLIVYVYTSASGYAHLPPQTQAETLAMQLSSSSSSSPSTSSSSSDGDGTTADWNSMDELSPDREMPNNNNGDSSDTSPASDDQMSWNTPCDHAVYCTQQSDCCSTQKCNTNLIIAKKVVETIMMFGIESLKGLEGGVAGFCVI